MLQQSMSGLWCEELHERIHRRLIHTLLSLPVVMTPFSGSLKRQSSGVGSSALVQMLTVFLCFCATAELPKSLPLGSDCQRMLFPETCS